MNIGAYFGTEILKFPFGATLARIEELEVRRTVILPSSSSSITDMAIGLVFDYEPGGVDGTQSQWVGPLVVVLITF